MDVPLDLRLEGCHLPLEASTWPSWTMSPPLSSMSSGIHCILLIGYAQTNMSMVARDPDTAPYSSSVTCMYQRWERRTSSASGLQG